MSEPGDEAHPTEDLDVDEEHQEQAQEEPSKESAASSGTKFANLPEFVEEFLLHVWRREPTAGCWCQRWWEHPEAVLRLEATWDAFELLRMEPGTGVSVWIRDHLDYHMGMLTTRTTSPFKLCDVPKDRHDSPAVWPVAPAPAGMFQDIGVEVDNDSSQWLPLRGEMVCPVPAASSTSLNRGVFGARNKVPNPFRQVSPNPSPSRRGRADACPRVASLDAWG